MGHRPLWSGRPVAWDDGLVVRSACRSLGMTHSAPGGVAQRERRRGLWLRRWGYGGHAGWNVFQELVPENRERSANYPVNARNTFSFSKHSGSGWALGGHPETSAQPDAECTRCRAGRPLWPEDWRPDRPRRGRPAPAGGVGPASRVAGALRLGINFKHPVSSIMGVRENLSQEMQLIELWKSESVRTSSGRP